MQTEPLPVRRLPLSLAALAGLILLLAACGNGASGTPSASESAAASSAAASDSAEASESEAAESEAAEGDVTVTLVGFAFTGDDVDTSGDVPTLTVPAGTRVVFVNEDAARHTATHGTDGAADPAAAFDINLGSSGASGSFTFEEAGEFPVTCKVHPDMNLTVIVE
ncbi:MAG TPA: plastocyanin/azurin family copper-binding protein [Candidatus Limnocylindria bacterium]|nr:plastocyanin/azurin family copper-binding protein [Candidatus Limnocylindria bacterium]